MKRVLLDICLLIMAVSFIIYYFFNKYHADAPTADIYWIHRAIVASVLLVGFIVYDLIKLNKRK